jgi:hypothetical protein
LKLQSQFEDLQNELKKQYFNAFNLKTKSYTVFR